MSDTTNHGSAQPQNLRLKLVGKALIGFDTNRWASNGSLHQTASRIGAKGGPTPPPVAPRT